MRYVITFIISFICFLTLQFLQVNNLFVIGAVGILILAGVLIPTIQPILWETETDKIERFLLKNKKNPNFYIVYVLANEMDEEVKDITEKLIDKNKQVSRQALYKIGEALYFKNYPIAKKQLEHIKSVSYRLYYQAILLLEDDDIDGTNEVIEKISIKWMKNALLAEREKKLNNILGAKNYAEQAKLHTKGLQRYLLHKTYEREFGL